METVYTIGHSVHTVREFVEMLRAYGVTVVVDVRSVARSAYVAQFNSDTFSLDLEIDGIEYVHMPRLGGFLYGVKPKDGFKEYRKFMKTQEFDDSVNELMEIARDKKVAIMCSEGVPHKCHRSLIADALVARGVEVVHIMSATSSVGHVQRTLEDV